MSHKATDWAFEQKLPALQKLVLIVLADRHNKDTGRCDPSLSLVAEDCGMSKTAVKEAIRALQEKGLIVAHKRFYGASQLTNFYTFNLSKESTPQSPHVPPPVATRPTPQSPRAPKPVIEPVIEPLPTQGPEIGQSSCDCQGDELYFAGWGWEERPHPSPPKKKSSAQDPRFNAVKDYAKEYWDILQPGKIFPFNGRGGAAIRDLLSAWPSVASEEFAIWFTHMANSDNVLPSLLPHEYIKILHKFKDGRLNQFGRLKES